MKKLIVNADDFGLTKSITDGIIKSFTNGIVRSASFIVNTDAFEYSVKIAKEHPALDIGIHITWVGEDAPLLKDVESIRKGDHFYTNWKWVLWKDFFRKIKLEEAEREAIAQVEKLIGAGIHPTHIDSHQHLHLLPGLSEIVIKIAKNYHIPFVRCPALSRRTLKRIFYLPLNIMSKRLKKNIMDSGLPKPPDFIGFEYSGKLDTGKLVKILKQLNGEVSELMVHPGYESASLHKKYPWGYKWEDELNTLISAEALSLIEKNHFELTSFKELQQTLQNFLK